MSDATDMMLRIKGTTDKVGRGCSRSRISNASICTHVSACICHILPPFVNKSHTRGPVLLNVHACESPLERSLSKLYHVPRTASCVPYKDLLKMLKMLAGVLERGGRSGSFFVWT